MAELPGGTVTFLFTDIEGSTRLLQRLGDRYAEVLDAQRRILRGAVVERDGREVDTQGDSFFFAFARANAALGAAVAAQRALAGHDWPEGCDVRVRMGLHTGEPAVADERYVGLGVHRAARIGAVAHGGQALLSSSTRELVEDEAGGVSIRDLGSYLLKDFDRPEHLFQLDVDGLQTEFPPLKAERVSPRPAYRRRAILLSAVAGAVAAAVAIPIFAVARGGGAPVRTAVGDSVGVVDSRSGKLVADVGVGATPSAIAADAGAIWVANGDGNSLTRIDPARRVAVDTIPVGRGPAGVAIGNRAVWVANSLDGTVARVDPDTNSVVQTIAVGNGPLGLLYAAGSVWVANVDDGTITKIDADSGTPTKTLPIAATELAFGAGTLWASERDANRVARIDPATGKQVATILVGNGPTGIGFGAGAAWVANSLDGTVSRIDPGTNSVRATVLSGNGPTAVNATSRGVWVSNEFDGRLVRIDPRTNQVAQRLVVGSRLHALATSDEDVLVAVRGSGAGHRGGVLRVRMTDPVDSIDTAAAYGLNSAPIIHMTNDGLVAYDHTSGLAGTQLVPDLAVALPAPTDGGRTYTFRLRPDIRYSNGRPVTASDFRTAFERDFAIGKLYVQYYDGIVGADRCRKNPRHCDLSRGIVANDTARTVAFHLVAPDAEFLYKLTLGYADATPTGTPATEARTHPLPATGPYMIKSYRPGLLRLTRNPYFHEWSKAAQPDGYPNEIVFETGGSADHEVADVLHGTADVFSSSLSSRPLSTQMLETLRLRHASQVHSNPQPGTFALFLNTRVAPFDRVEVRRAMNYAADRAAAVKVVGGPDVAQPTCQVLPPGFPGYRRYCPYGSAPSLARARALVARSGTRGMHVTYWSFSYFDEFAPYAVELLRSLGYRVSTKTLGDEYYDVVGDSRTGAQIGLTVWISDYPTPSAFVNALLSCAAFLPNSKNNLNTAGFCDPRLDRRSGRALSEQVTNPYAARGVWEQLDRRIVDEAPWVPLVNPKTVDVLSRRVGNYQYSANGLGMLLDQLWVH